MRSPIPLLALALLLPSIAQARPGWTSGTFVYASLCTQPDGGGVTGRRVVLRRSPNGDDATYEAASGRLGAPLPVESLSIDDERREIAFTVERDGQPIRFRGTAAVDGLAGTISDANGEHPLHLRRVLRSHEHEECRAIAPDPDTTASAR